MDNLAEKNLLEKKAWSVPEVAGMLQISVAMAYNMVRNGSIPSKTLGVRRRIVPKDAFELWLKEVNGKPQSK